MSQFSAKKFDYRDIPDGDNGVFVRDIVKLIDGSPFREAIYDALEIDKILDKRIEIPGARKLVDAVDSESRHYLKFDVKSSFEDLTFEHVHDENRIDIGFSDLSEISYPNIVDEDTDSIIQAEFETAESKYSAMSTLFKSVFNINEYASSLTAKGYRDVVMTNLSLLENIYRNADKRQVRHVRRYRMLRDSRDSKYYFRAMISEKRYQDYNIGVSVFIALVLLREAMEESKNKDSFRIRYCEYTESYISIQFEKTVGKTIDKLGDVKFIVELSNNEIAKGAVKFSGLFSIKSIKGDEIGETVIKNSLGSPILSLSHGTSPDVAIADISFAKQVKEVEAEVYRDIEAIRKAGSPDILRHVFKTKIESGRTLEKGKKEQLKRLLSTTVNNFHELLVLMNKAELLVADENIESKDYLRYIMFKVLTETRKG